MQYANIKKIEGLSKLKNLETLVIAVKDIPGDLTEIEGLENLKNLDNIRINTFNFNRFPNYRKAHAKILRFACIAKSSNYESIEDWEDNFVEFPEAFLQFQEFNSKDKVDWFIEQCSINLLDIIHKILSDPKYNEMREGKESDWKKIQDRAQKVFS